MVGRGGSGGSSGGGGGEGQGEGGGLLVATAILDLVGPLLVSPLVLYSTTLAMLSMLLLRYTRPAAAFQLQQSSSAFLRRTISHPRFPRVASGLFSSYASDGQVEVKSIPSVLHEVFTPTGTLMPKVVHRLLEEKDVGERLIVVGDVHGCLDELKALLQVAAYNPAKDTVCLVGDLVNKGLKSAETVRFAREQGFYAVRGNHDDSALAAYFRAGRFKEGVPPAYAYVNDFKPEDAKWLNDLPYTISIPHLQALVVHAGVVPGVPLDKQTAAHMSRIRSVLKEKDGGFEGVDFINPETSEPWAKCYEGPTQILFGHDAKRMLQLWPSATGLDTGCCYGKQLTAVILPSKERISVPAFQMYSKPGGKD